MIKAIAVDMDGTFLDAQGNYQRARFEEIYQKLLQRKIKFIVASGNQYYQLKSFFPGKDDTITYVAENGAIIGDQTGIQSVAQFSNELIASLIDYLLASEDELEFVLCGVKSAYVLQAASSRFKEFAKQYYYEMQEVASFASLPADTFVKIALDVEVSKTNAIVAQLNQQFAAEILAVSSGHGSIDIIIPGITKGSTLTKLLAAWSIDPNELVAFGDANNDLEMLALTEHSYAMADCSPQVRATAKHQAPSNNDAGVLAVIENYLQP